MGVETTVRYGRNNYQLFKHQMLFLHIKIQLFNLIDRTYNKLNKCINVIKICVIIFINKILKINRLLNTYIQYVKFYIFIKYYS